MTIAAGFLCTDGILLASDTLYEGVNKQYDRKIWMVHGKDGPTSVAFAGAGRASFLERVRDEVTERLAACREDPSAEYVRDVVEGSILSIHHKHKSFTGEESDYPLTVLVAIRRPDGCTIFKSDRATTLARVNAPAACIGWGEPIGSYITAYLYQRAMTLRWASVVAAHLIRLAKLYAADCGGDTHLLLMPTKGPPELLTDQTRIIRPMEVHLEKLDDALRVVLPGGDFEASDFTLTHRLDELVKAIESVRSVQAAVGISGVSACAMAGSVTPVVVEPTKKPDDQDLADK